MAEDDRMLEEIFLSTEVGGNTITPTSKIRNRAWFLTIFGLEKRYKKNYFGEDTEDDPMRRVHILIRNLKTQYFVYQKEKCPTTGREHVHAVLYFKNPRIWPKDEFENFRPNIGKVRNLEKAIEYCSKEKTRIDGPWEEGEKPEQGKRTDLAECCEMLKSGKKIKDIAKLYPESFVKFHRGLRELQMVLSDHRDPENPPRIFWFWGKTRRGKSREAHRIAKDEYENDFYKKDNTKWWNNYEQQKVIIIDDFNPTKWDFRDLLNVCDRYEIETETKGGYVKINSELIIITCDRAPKDIWPPGNDRDQVVERLDEIREFLK